LVARFGVFPSPLHHLNYLAINPMTRLKAYTLVLIAVLCSIGCDRMATSPGAHPLPMDSDYLLPDGKRWKFDLVLPDDVSAGDVLRLEIRKYQIDEANEGSRSNEQLPVEQANDIWLGPAFRVNSSNDRALVALQLLDLRDYSTSTEVENPLRLAGGLSLAGSLGQLRNKANFVVGVNEGISPSSQTSWRDHEIRLLRFWSVTKESEFVYDVCVRVVKGKQEQLKAAMDESSQ
jgi:hypothetical protein